jgi:hypothetical protein
MLNTLKDVCESTTWRVSELHKCNWLDVWIGVWLCIRKHTVLPIDEHHQLSIQVIWAVPNEFIKKSVELFKYIMNMIPIIRSTSTSFLLLSVA